MSRAQTHHHHLGVLVCWQDECGARIVAVGSLVGSEIKLVVQDKNGRELGWRKTDRETFFIDQAALIEWYLQTKQCALLPPVPAGGITGP